MVPRRGYRFIAPVHKDGTHAAGVITAADGRSLRPLNEVDVPDEGLVERSTGPAVSLSPPQPTIPRVSVEIAPRASGRVRDVPNLLTLIGGRRSDTDRTYRTRRLWVLALGLAAILGVFVKRNDVLKAPSVLSATRFPVSVPEGDTLVGDDGLSLAPNGRSVVYGAWHRQTALWSGRLPTKMASPNGIRTRVLALKEKKSQIPRTSDQHGEIVGS